jgi:hypothetical protein
MNTQRYYAVLDAMSEIDLSQSKVVEHLGCYDMAYDALDRFLLFYNPEQFFLYSYPHAMSTGELIEMQKVETDLPSFVDISRCLAI